MIDLVLHYLPWAIAMIVAGLLAGFVAGLLGVGGGIVIVPVLDTILATLDVDPSLRMKVAVASSLATIVATSWASARSHKAHDAVDFDLLKSWGPMIFIGVVLGTYLAGIVDARVLKLVFATVALLIAANMFLRSKSQKLADGFPNMIVKGALGFVVGTVSAMMGVGGGTLGVAILTAFGWDIRRAVGTASAIGFIIAVPGTIGFMIAGWGVPDLPPGSIGYVNLIAVAAIIPLSILTAPYGARVAHTIPRQYLAYGFGFFLVITAIKMLWGFFA
ncbi:sulfite exporter TauE/SafE family protein [Mesorhizobium sp. VNQ89]|uniref:sulfite exporter TauE/SafE family protein n=1 Tax=Mesorhizobium quangtriensis TaxID=3157709 RepID=UPI0032B76861